MQLLASNPDCVQVLSRTGQLQYLNEHGRCLLELEDVASLLGKAWASFWPEKMRTAVDEAVSGAMAGQTRRFSGYCPTAKGTAKWWDVAVSPIYDQNGEAAWILCVSRDITKQKTTEAALLVSEQHFRALADNIAPFAWMTDASGFIFWYNQRWFDYTGMTLEEMRGWGWQKVHHPDYVQGVTERFEACLKSGEVWEDTFPLRGRDGNYRWFLSRAMPIRDEQGNVTLWCGTNTDITDQRNANLRLRQLARLIELSHEAISVSSLANGILLWNRGCEELYGYSQSEALGKDSHELLKSDNILPKHELERLLLTEGTWSGEIGRTAKDGGRVWVDCRKEVIRIGDENVVLETDRDITERRKADEVRNLLVGELNHRVKNTLAIVQSIASQTARSSLNMSDFVSRFNGRLQSVSNAHNVLTDGNWSGAQLGELIKSQIGALAAGNTRIRLSGPDVFVPPQAALQLTLILHELAANAMIYGALSNTSGVVNISWETAVGPSPNIVLIWKESGGPPVVPPKTLGFGLSLIERSGRLPHLQTSIAFPETGVECRIAARLDEKRECDKPFFDPAKSLASA